MREGSIKIIFNTSKDNFGAKQRSINMKLATFGKINNIVGFKRDRFTVTHTNGLIHLANKIIIDLEYKIIKIKLVKC